MSDRGMNINAGRARLAAGILVEVWQQLGSNQADYDLVWRAKEYLQDAADELNARVQAWTDSTDMCRHCCQRVPKSEIEQGLHNHPAAMD